MIKKDVEVAITTEDVTHFLTKNPKILIHMEVSAKTGENVDNLFNTLAKRVIDLRQN